MALPINMLKGHAAMATAQMLFGVYNVVCKQALDGIPMLGFGLWRWALSLPIIWLYSRLPESDKVQRVESWKDAGLLVGVAASGFFGCSALTLLALTLTSAPIFAISQCSSPMITALVAWGVGMERLGLVKFTGIIIGVAAAGYCIWARDTAPVDATLASESQPLLVGGVIMAFLLCAAVYALLNKQLSKYNGATIRAWGFCSATAFFLLAAVGYFVHRVATSPDEVDLMKELQLWWPPHWETTNQCRLRTK